MTDKGLPQTIEELRRLLLAQQQQLAQERQKVVELTGTLAEQQKKLDRQDRTIEELLRALKGKKRERIDPAQMMLFDAGELEQALEEAEAAEADEEASRTKKKRRRRGRRLIPDNLPQVEQLHELPEEQRICPVDGAPMPFIRWEESRQLDYIPAQLQVIVHKRAVYACPHKTHDTAPVRAPKAAQPVEGGLPTAGLLAGVTVSKFADHLSGYRIEDILARSGCTIRRSTIYDWLTHTADLVLPLYLLMKQRVLESGIIHTDDTSVKLIDATAPGGSRTARFWAYQGDRGHPYIVYDFTTSRRRDGPDSFLADFEGYLQADAYSGYDGIYMRPGRPITEVACWTHARRYWIKARDNDPDRAHHALAFITRLYAVESRLKNCSDEFRCEQRRTHSAPILAEFGSWLEEQACNGRILPKSPISAAITYTRNQWTALNRYTEHGELDMDNNAAERDMKPVAIGRKAWLFTGSVEAGRRAAVLMTMMNSAKFNRVEPWVWLTAVLNFMAAHRDAMCSPEAASGEADLNGLLPNTWLAANPQHRLEIADIRQAERERESAL